MLLVDKLIKKRYNDKKKTKWEYSGTMSIEKKRFQVSFTDDQFEKLTLAALKKGLTKSSLLSVIFEEWLEEQENKSKG